MPLPMRDALDVQQTWTTFKDWLLRLYDHTAVIVESAAASEAAALASLNDFKGRYYGALATAPVFDPLGAAINAGDMYYNTTINGMMVYRGDIWVNYEASALASKTAAGLSETAAAGSAGISTAQAVLAVTARTKAETARDLAQAASLASTVALAAKDTIALGRASVADGQTFWVKPNSTDGLTRFTAYLCTSSTTQSFISDIAPGSELDAAINTLRKVGKNIFNKDQVFVANTRMHATTGVPKYSTDWAESLSEFIPVTGSTTYAFHSVLASTVGQYDANKAFITPPTNHFSTAPLTTAANTQFIRVSLSPSMISTQQIEAGATRTAYEPYAKLLDTSLLNMPALLARSELAAAVAMLTPGKNIFDQSSLTASSSFRSDGLAEAGGNYITGFMSVVSSATYVSNAAGAVTVYEYDVRQAFVSSGNVTSTAPRTVSATTKFVRLMVHAEHLTGLQFEKSAVPTAYEPFAMAWRGSLEGSVVLAAIPTVVAQAQTNAAAIATHENLLRKVGKNIFDKTAAVTVNSGFNATTGVIGYSASWGESITGFMPVAASSAYVISVPTALKLVQYDAAKNLLVAPVQYVNAASFTTAATAAFIRVEFSPSESATLQIELGTVRSMYEPYALAFDSSIINKEALVPGGANLAVLTEGKNLFNKDGPYLLTSRIASTGGRSGETTTSASWTEVVFTAYIPVKPSTAYSANTTFTTNVHWYDARKAYLGTNGAYRNVPITSPATAAFCRLVFYSLATSLTAQFEEGAVNTFYEPYALGHYGPISRAQIKAALPGFANDIAMPLKQYFLKGAENTVYFQALQRRWSEDEFYTRVTGGAMLNRQRYSRITPTAVGTFALTTSLHNADFNVEKKLTSTAVVKDATTPTTEFSLLTIGDSYTFEGHYLRRVLDLIPNVTTVGMRKISVANVAGTVADVYHEGRSGWRMGSSNSGYFITAYEPLWKGFSPFLQPAGVYKYFGNTKSWKEAYVATPSAEMSGFKFTGDKIGINGTTGYLAAPAVNDVMYDDDLAAYKVWDGSAWTTISAATLALAFNFAKYRVVFQVAKPSAVAVMMGINDFAGAADWRDVITTLFPAWKVQMDALIASVFADGVTKVALLMPPSVTGRMNDYGGVNFTLLKNACMWEARKLILATYDNREGEGIYVVDTGSSLDPDYGISINQYIEKPFADFEGTELITYTNNAPHPSRGGYYQMATRIAAWIQAVR